MGWKCVWSKSAIPEVGTAQGGCFCYTNPSLYWKTHVKWRIWSHTQPCWSCCMPFAPQPALQKASPDWYPSMIHIRNKLRHHMPTRQTEGLDRKDSTLAVKILGLLRCIFAERDGERKQKYDDRWWGNNSDRVLSHTHKYLWVKTQSLLSSSAWLDYHSTAPNDKPDNKKKKETYKPSQDKYHRTKPDLRAGDFGALLQRAADRPVSRTFGCWRTDMLPQFCRVDYGWRSWGHLNPQPRQAQAAQKPVHHIGCVSGRDRSGNRTGSKYWTTPIIGRVPVVTAGQAHPLNISRGVISGCAWLAAPIVPTVMTMVPSRRINSAKKIQYLEAVR